MPEITVYEGGGQVATADQIKAHVQRVQQVMKAVMKPDTHYGTIPGTPKPTLYKAGSEVLLSTFRIAVEPEVDDLSTSDEVRYRVRCVGRHQTSGITVGWGIGECSSSEEKYRWRNSVCDDEWEETAPDRRRVKYQKGKDGSVYTRKQVRTEPADVANTVLKMAKKRAQIDLTLTATAASDIFAQDLEDLPEGLRESVADDDRPTRAATRAPAAKKGSGTATEKQVALIQRRLDAAGVSAADLCATLKIDSLPELPFGRVDEALEAIGSLSHA